ncbi:LCP family protein [Ornithinicoccus halotolerans]|uniref:LCP family protein n=1 Tax=Ornithinicoccus halotolerans TaxID=1748220 RepID=UPI001885B116|nr:LCP family protein [Ornithinicoccus halotolerans]
MSRPLLLAAAPGRRSLRGCALLLVVSLVAAGCSGDQSTDTTGEPGRATATAPAERPGRTSEAAPRTEEPEPAVQVNGVPRGPRRVAQALYGGGDVPARGNLGTRLARRTPAEQDVTVRGAAGRWQGTRVAVLTHDDDLTLLVEGSRGWQVVGGQWPSLGIERPLLGGRRHVLLIGSDAREQQGQPVDRMRADALQVVGVDGAGGGGVMGIARDSWVTMPSGGEAKINQAMVEAGPEGQLETVRRVTGLPVEGYVLVGFEGFTAFVDDWGGVTIDAPRAFDGFPEGVQELTGYWLLRWTRHRKTLPGGDFDRSFHQGVALAGIGLQARGAGPLALPQLLELVDTHMESNLDAEQVMTLAAWAYLGKPARFGHEVATGSVGWSGDGQSIVRLDEDARRTFADFTDGRLGD